MLNEKYNQQDNHIYKEHHMDKSLSEQVINLNESITITFKFDCGDVVVTPFGDTGIVDDCMFNGDGNKYWVNSKGNEGKWYKEDQLKITEKT